LTDSYQHIIEKIDRFIRKYYKNQLIKGAIYCISLLAVFFLLADLLEYYGHFNTQTRAVIFYTYLFLTIATLIKYIFIPVSKLFKFGKRISYEQAAGIIGDFFPEVSDKLINTLQLKKLESESVANIELIEAGIEQKTNELKPVPFTSAIHLSKNRRYLKYALPPILVILAILFISPNIITEPAERIVKHNVYFEEKLPFSVEVENENLQVIQHEDFKLRVKVTGDEVPENIYIQTGNNRIKLNRESPVSFYYTFLNVQKERKFRLISDRFESEEYRLKVLPKPVILDFTVHLDYPAYTGKKDEDLSNNGDIIIPEGSNVTWKFFTKNTDIVNFRFGDEIKKLPKNSSNAFVYSKRFFQNRNYSVSVSNKFLRNTDSLSYRITVIPDLYPTIAVERYSDSVYDKRLYFKGAIKDDYGFRLLTFNYKIKKDGGGDENLNTDTIDINKSINTQQYFHFFDITSLNLEPGDGLEYYFEVWDNDGVNGSKSSRTQLMEFKTPTLKQVDEKAEKSNKMIKEKLDDAMKDVKKLQKDIDEINKKLYDKKELNWEDKQQIKQLLEKQQELKNTIENIKKENKEKALQEQEYKNIDKDIIEKQKQLEELFNKLMQDEELNKLFEELKELLEQVDKDKVSEMLEQMKMSNEELEKMLDRDLELFKQLEFEQKLDETIKKLDKLAKKQDKLAEKTEKKELSSEESKKEQEKIQEEFNDLKKEMDKLDSLNKQLEQPNDFDKQEESRKKIDDEMNKANESLNKNQRKKASKSQKSAAQQMQEMQQSMEQMQESMAEEGMEEDMETLRGILENLIQLSFSQENLIHKVNNMNLNDPKYNELSREQKNIKDDLQVVEDSLFALSKRQIMIEPFVTREISSINNNIGQSIKYLNDRRLGIAASKQQYAMTSINNLALMLSETLNQMMQSMMQQQCSGNKSCKTGKPKPGAGQSSMKSMRQLQEQLNKQIESLKKGMKDKGKKPGGKYGKNSDGMSEQLAKLAAQQEALRNQMQKYSEQLSKEGQMGASKELKKTIKKMEETETDLVNKRITQQTLMRQQEILTRMLKSEKAEMEREMKEERESKEAKDQKYRNPDELFKYKQKQSNEVELLRTVPPGLKQFYKNKVNEYFFNFEER
jgi:hypothetical protein